MKCQTVRGRKLVQTFSQSKAETIARHRIPDVVSDSGPQYSSQHFKSFAKKWGFSHETSSPGKSKANGAAEAAVRVAKNIMKKCHDAKEDDYLGLLNLRNTPQESLTTSPAQRLMGRRPKTTVPPTFNLLKPAAMEHIECEKQCTENKRLKVVERHNDRKYFKSLQVGAAVRMQPIDNTKWKEATATQRLRSRTYDVTACDGRNYRRNRVFLRSTHRNPASNTSEIVHRPTTPPSHLTHTPRPCRSEKDPHCAADSTPAQPAEVSGGPEEPYTRPHMCIPKDIVLHLSIITIYHLCGVPLDVYTKGHRSTSGDVPRNLTANVFNNHFLPVAESLTVPRI